MEGHKWKLKLIKISIKMKEIIQFYSKQQRSYMFVFWAVILVN